MKNLAAVALSKLGASKGGKARAAKLTAERRVEIAKKAAAARWGKKCRPGDCEAEYLSVMRGKVTEIEEMAVKAKERARLETREANRLDRVAEAYRSSLVLELEGG